MELYIGADHRGMQLKDQLSSWLIEQGHVVIDEGNSVHDPQDDYPEFARKVAQKVSENPDDRMGILLCGSGVGMAVAANKIPGIRAALVHDPAIAASARRDDNANVIALGADHISLEDAMRVVEAFISTPFSGEERHRRRVAQVSDLERR